MKPERAILDSPLGVYEMTYRCTGCALTYTVVWDPAAPEPESRCGYCGSPVREFVSQRKIGDMQGRNFYKTPTTGMAR
jgi:rRNA maturation endonuclease Nob1